jgi:hypothetical protein
MASKNPPTSAPNQQFMFDLLQAASGLVCDSGAQTIKFAQRLAELSAQLKQPTAIESIHSIVNELLSETTRMCSINLELARSLDRYAEQALELMSSREGA